MSTPHHSPHPGGSENIEKRDVHFPPIVLALVGLTFFIIGSILICYFCFKGLEVWFNKIDKPVPPMFESRMTPPEPALQATPYADLKVYQAEQKKLVESYAVLDPEAGITRIPVSRAMQMLAEKPDFFREKKAEAPAAASKPLEVKLEQAAQV